VARKLAVICWHMLREEADYAFARPSFTREKIRRLELAVGAERQPGRRHAVRAFAPRAQHDLERELSAQAEAAYLRLMRDWQAAPGKAGAGATRGRASNGRRGGTAARQTSEPQDSAL